MRLNRREWLLGGGSAIALSLFPARLLAAPTAGLKPPVARVAPVQDVYFGETLVDRYRWMENSKDPDSRIERNTSESTSSAGSLPVSGRSGFSINTFGDPAKDVASCPL